MVCEIILPVSGLSYGLWKSVVICRVQSMKKWAVLRVLYEVYQNDPEKPFLRLRDLRKRPGIPFVGAAKDRNSLVHGVLIQLWDEACVEPISRGRWQITDEGISSVEIALNVLSGDV